MTPERYQQIGTLYHAALELDDSQRAAFLDQACDGDEALRREVESLIASHEQAGSFMKGAAVEEAARMLVAAQGESLAGQRLGHYEILVPLGAGGMGEVYLAHDTSLGRQVAIKLLSSRFTADKDRLRRFQQEARAASALNHPNILTIHEIGQADSAHFIATEFIDGVTLRQRMVSRRMTILEALDGAVQVASALAAAHQAGIAHRDIKPENIMLRPDGYVKVLDFGLAKLAEKFSALEAADGESPTRALINTEAGMVMGTVSYMSPEQVRGLVVDARTDIWSLGVVLYEMIAGDVPFEGATTSDVIVSILERDPPPLIGFSPEIPAELGRIVTKALRKDKEERYQTANALAVDLRHLKQRLELDVELQRDSYSGQPAVGTLERTAPPNLNGQVRVNSTGGSPAAQRESATAAAASEAAARPTRKAEYLVSEIRRHQTGALLLVALLVIALAGFVFLLLRSRQSNEAQNQGRAGSGAAFQAMKITRVTTSGKAVDVAISPDGKYVAYLQDEGGQQSLWVRQVATSSNLQIVGPAREVSYSGLTFSRDGNYIYYVKAAKDNPISALYQIPALGGNPRKLSGNISGSITFSPDDRRVAFTRQPDERGESTLMVMNTDGTGEQRLATRNLPYIFDHPAWSPDGKIIACAVLNISAAFSWNLEEVRVEDGAEKPISSQRWWSVGRIGWLRDGSGLIAPAADQTTGSPGSPQLWLISYPGGEARRITNDLNGYSSASLTADSTALVTVQHDQPSNIWVAPHADASQARQITSGLARDGGYGVSWTPDGKIVYSSVASGRDDLWIMDADGKNQKQLTADAGGNSFPSVSPDGRYIVFMSSRTGSQSIWRMEIDGSNPTRLTDDNSHFPRCTSDGKWVLYYVIVPSGGVIWKVPIEGGLPVQLADPRSGAYGPDPSPDGKLIACKISSSFRVAILPFEGGEPIKTFGLTGDPIRETRWTSDSRGLTYIDDRNGVSNIWIQSIDGGPAKQLTNFKSDRTLSFDWSRDGKQLALARGTQISDVVLIRDSK